MGAAISSTAGYKQRSHLRLATQRREAIEQTDWSPVVPDANPIPVPDVSGRYLDREISLMQFFWRVLEEAFDTTQPVLERVKFLSILSENLDEHFMVRVSGLKEARENTEVSEDKEFSERLNRTREFLKYLFAEQSRCFRHHVIPALRKNGINLTSWVKLSDNEQRFLRERFLSEMFPLLTPQSVDFGHPFPYVEGLVLNLGLIVRPSVDFIQTTRPVDADPRFVRIGIPKSIPRLVSVSGSSSRFVFVEDLIAANIAEFFPGMDTSSAFTFRVTRDADVETRDDKAADLLASMESKLRRRRFGLAVRLEIERAMPAEMADLLCAKLNLGDEDIFRFDGPLDLSGLAAIYSIDRPDLKEQPITAIVPPELSNAKSCFEAIAKRDILLHHPYHSYSVITDFIDQAADDPTVLAIKICLYRTGKNSPIPQALIRACESGKQVTAVVELKARFDEENNIEWAKRLEQAGANVVYGVVGLKTHSKLAMVVRLEKGNIRRYVHVASGNYNPVTAGFYTDMGLLTADPDTASDVAELFNFLTGFSRQKKARKLLISPAGMRESMLALINRETANARLGKPARIIAKINRLADRAVIEALYEASTAGVQIDLVVRGLCTLRPNVAGLSENINVRSIVGRYLEHSRIFYFLNGGEPAVFIGSSDWMTRNFDRRVEVVMPVEDLRLKSYLCNEVLETYLADNTKARQLMADGRYERVLTKERIPVNSQIHFAGRFNGLH